MLKTLKDISIVAYNLEEKDDKAVWQSELRQEAIKWIKEIDKMQHTPEDIAWECITREKIVYSEEAKEGIKNFIKHFFNISEED